MKKNFYFYTNLFAWTLVFLLIGNYVFGWTTPTGNPPTSNLSVPLNVSLTNQSKEGYLAIGTSTVPTIPLDVTGTANMTTLSIGGTSITTTAEELNFIDGVTSSIQTQLGTKAPLASPTFTGNVTMPGTGIWNSSGNVGIGTTGPLNSLEVSGTGARFTGAYTENTTNTGVHLGIISATPRIGFFNGTAAQNWQIDNNSGAFRWYLPGVVHMSLNTTTLSLPNKVISATGTGNNYFAGNVGIGTTGPVEKLYVNSTSGDARIGLNAPIGSDTEIKFSNNAVVEYTIGHDDTTDNFVIGTTNVDIPKMSIDKTGNVGIGTTAPLSKLGVLGNLSIGATYGSIAAPTSGLIIEGNVGFGTTGPDAKVHIVGGVCIDTDGVCTDPGAGNVTIGDGAGKVYVGTIDPVYTINGKSYATYLSGMIGVKEETTGIIKIENSKCKNQNSVLICEYGIDFNNLEEDSDLWLFSKTTNLKDNFDKMVVLLTPAFDGKIWYDKDINEKHLTIFVIPNSEYVMSQVESLPIDNLEISYRLTAPRFDYNQWSNYSDIDAEGFNLDKLLN